MEIRKAGHADVIKIVQLVVECSMELEDNHSTPNQSEAIAIAVGHGIDNNEAVFIAEDDGKIVGYVAWVHLPGNARGHVEGCGTFVKPELRRTGLSKKLRTYAIMHAKSKGYHTVRGVASKTNEAALASVLKSGFNVVGIMVERKF